MGHTSHSRHSSVNSVNNSNHGISDGHQEEIKMNVEYDADVNLDDEELQQQRQRHQDQYLESMPTSQNGFIHVYPHRQHHRNSNQNKRGIIISTVSVCHPQRNDMKEISPCSFPSQSQSQYSITSDTQSVSVSQSILEKTIVESQEPSTSHLVPVHEDNIDFITKRPEMSANLSFSNVSNKAVKLEISLDHRNSTSVEQELEEEQESENKVSSTMHIRSKPPLKNNNNHSFIQSVSDDSKSQMNDNSPSKSARRKKRRKNKKSSTK